MVLYKDQLEELHEWLEEKGYESTNIGKAFADGVEMAKLLKQLYPKMVDLNNYPQRSSTLLKVNNWSLLNTKVLAKLKIYQTKSRIEEIARAKTDVIEELLYKLMKLQQNEVVPVEKPNETEEKWEEDGDIITIKIQRVIDNKVVETKRKLILFTIYENLLKDLKTQCERLAESEQKISHLMRVLALKTDRITELRKKLDIETSKTLL